MMSARCPGLERSGARERRKTVAADIGDYALIGDCRTAALVSSQGTIDWLCWPRFDSDACLAALLGDEGSGCWRMTPRHPVLRTERRYRPDTLVLETRMATVEGTVQLLDFMPIRDGTSDIVRIVVGESGQVHMRTKLGLRFDYGRARPWFTRLNEHLVEAIAGPHAVTIQASTTVGLDDGDCICDFSVKPGQRTAFVARYRPSHRQSPAVLDAEQALQSTEQAWRDWSSRCTYIGPWRDAVIRSLITLKALTYRPTGAIVAAVTTSLTESPDVPKNWDYRYCWLRDAGFAMLAFIQGGYREEAAAWRDWLLRAIAGTPEQLQPVYGIAGEPRISEWKVPWLSGRSRRHGVRVGNTAFGQVQLDVYGEVIDALHHAREYGIRPTEAGAHVEAALVEQIERIWKEPDRGIWESRHAPEQFTHSKVMAWAGIDRAIRGAERHGGGSPIKRWRRLREAIHADVCERGFDATLGAFARSYETRIPDASALLIPIVGFLPADDPRVAGTVRVIEKCLSTDGFVRRFDSSKIPGEAREGAFLACSFWLIDNFLLKGQRDRAEAMFERLLAIRNDVGLLAEEYDPDSMQFRGNFPQALSHLSLVNTAFGLARPHGSPRRTRGHKRAPEKAAQRRRVSAISSVTTSIC